MAIAYFITFTTYGTWLHGTDKGKGSVDRRHNQYRTAFAPAAVGRLRVSAEAMLQPAYTLDDARRTVVRDAIVSLRDGKGWRLWAAHVRTNHVHVVVWADRDPGRLMSDLKNVASRGLTAAGFDDADRKRWTRHGSTLHLFDAEQVQRKVAYTLGEQGPPMAVYDGRNSLG